MIKKFNFELWFYIISFIIIGLGCHTWKNAWDKFHLKKHDHTLEDEDLESISDTPVLTASMANSVPVTVRAYVKRFARVAQAEQRKFGIPASVTLAQGILESNRGNSKLASQHNNHFGIKCWCRGKQRDCVPMADDSPRDRFKRYGTAWESYRHHSVFVSKMPLKVSKKSNYKDWAKALKKAGYATKRSYAEDLISIIERYELHQYDI